MCYSVILPLDKSALCRYWCWYTVNILILVVNKYYFSTFNARFSVLIYVQH